MPNKVLVVYARDAKSAGEDIVVRLNENNIEAISFDTYWAQLVPLSHPVIEVVEETVNKFDWVVFLMSKFVFNDQTKSLLPGIAVPQRKLIPVKVSKTLVVRPLLAALVTLDLTDDYGFGIARLIDHFD